MFWSATCVNLGALIVYGACVNVCSFTNVCISLNCVSGECLSLCESQIAVYCLILMCVFVNRGLCNLVRQPEDSVQPMLSHCGVLCVCVCVCINQHGVLHCLQIAYNT